MLRKSATRYAAILAAISLSIAFAGRAFGAATATLPTAPRNTTAQTASSIGRLPFTATTSTVDAAVVPSGAFCAGNSHAVWYKLFIRANTTIDADTLSSDYDTTLSAYTGPPTSLKQIACNDDAAGISNQSEILFDATAGQTVYLMAASFTGAPGGNLQLAVSSTTNTYPHHAKCRRPDQRSVANPCASDTPYYLAVGDSAPVWNGGRSYPDDILRSPVTRHVPGLKLVKTACSSETSDSFINFSRCGGSQLQKDVDFLTASRGHVALVTIDIGGNDVLPCASLTGIDWNCAQVVLTTIQTNLRTILSKLRQAAGPGVPIVGMNYYNPFLGYALIGPSVRPLIMQTVFGQQILNQLLGRTYAEFGVPVANVQDAFHSTDMTTIVSSMWGNVPRAVKQACTLLDITCIPGQAEVFGDDPNLAGAAVIAKAFEPVIGRLNVHRATPAVSMLTGT
jgi:hypothetical protein